MNPPVLADSYLMSVKAGAGEEDEAPVQNIEAAEGYYQFLNKIIRGQCKNLAFYGRDADEILANIPKESVDIGERLPK